MRGRNDDGVALILALLLMMILSAVAVSLIFLSNTETYASMNYRLMSQARYGAESGVHKAMNYLFNSYALPGSASDPLSNYDMTVSPVTYNGAPVVLSAVASVPSNYPSGTTVTAFSNAATGSLSLGGYNVQYGAYATLMSMQTFQSYGSGALTVVQTWQINADGTIGGARPAQVEVSARLEQQRVPINTFGVFATSGICGALGFGGGESTDSYDSTAALGAGGTPVLTDSSGDVGTNGNLTMNGNAIVHGSLSTPRTGVGKCAGGGVTALDANGGISVTEGIVNLPQALDYPTPAAPDPPPPTTDISLPAGATCADIPLSPPATCSISGSDITIMPNGAALSLGNIKLSGGQTLHLQAGTYDVNSFTLTGNSTLVVDEPPTVPGAPLGPVILNVAGQGETTPIDFSGGSLQNPSYKPEYFQILYGGTGTLSISGGTATAAMVFAPNADVTLTGGSDFYGEILGSTVTDAGGTQFHYDRSLKKKGFAAGNYLMSAFTWKKY